MYPNISRAVYLSVENMLMTLKYYESWRGKIRNQIGFSKEEKEALNLITFVFFKQIMLEEDEDVSAILPYALRRLYIKSLTWDCKPGNKKFFNDNVKNFDAQLAKSVMSEIPSSANNEEDRKALKDFVDFLEMESKKLSKKVNRVYKAARAFATLIEYEEVKQELRPDTIEQTRHTVETEIAKYTDLPYFSEIVSGFGEYGKLKQLLTAISWSRYTLRWQGYIFHPSCSILAHMLESAIVSYLMNMELKCESDWVKDFWIMLFHDIAEIWTDDIPGPRKNTVIFSDVSDFIKNAVGKEEVRLRDITEVHELKALDENFFTLLPDKLQEFFRNGIMLEDVESEEKRRFYKMADYFAADMEVWWNIRAGVRSAFSKSVLERSLTEKRTPEQYKVVTYFLEKCERITFL